MGERIKFAPNGETTPKKQRKDDLSEIVAEPKRGPLPKNRVETLKKVDSYFEELKQEGVDKRMAVLRKQIGLPQKTETVGVSLAELKARIADSQHKKLAASDFEPIAASAKMERSEILPPADIAGAKLADRTEHAEEPKGFWSKLKSFVTMSRDERAYQKFGQMSAETDETQVDRRTAAKGEAMMRAADKKANVADATVDEDAEAIKSSRLRDAFIKIDDMPQNMADNLVSKRMQKRANESATELKVGLREGQKEYDLDRQTDAFETKHTAMGSTEFKKNMRAGELRARAEQLEAEVESEARPGPNAEKGQIKLEKFKQKRVEIYEKLKGLRSIVESIKLGWFAHLKIDSAGYITNLPEGNENIVFEYLAKEKDRLGAKGKIDKANEIVEQMEALDEYTKLLVERDKLLTDAGQDNF